MAVNGCAGEETFGTIEIPSQNSSFRTQFSTKRTTSVRMWRGGPPDPHLLVSPVGKTRFVSVILDSSELFFESKERERDLSSVSGSILEVFVDIEKPVSRRVWVIFGVFLTSKSQILTAIESCSPCFDVKKRVSSSRIGATGTLFPIGFANRMWIGGAPPSTPPAG